MWLLPSPAVSVRKVRDLALGVNVMRKRGLFNPLRLDHGLRSLYNVRRYGPFAGVVMHAVQTRPHASAMVDERGELTFRQLDEQSNAVARGLRAAGVSVDNGAVIGILARDHRGMVLSLLAAGKLGVRAVLLNTGFAKPQFAAVTEREKISILLHDSEFIELMSAIPDRIPRMYTWVDESDQVDSATPTIDALLRDNATTGLPAPRESGGMVILTSGTTGTPKGAPRNRVSAFFGAQFLDRIPLPRNGTMVMAAPIFHGTGLSQFTIALALGNRVVFQQRRFNPEHTLATITKYQADALTVVPTMLQRMLDLPPEVLAKYSMASLRVIFASGSAIPPDVVVRTRKYFGEVLYNLYGSTECAVITVSTPEDQRINPGTAGRAPLGSRVALFDADRAPITARNVTGTIFIDNAHAFSGYTDGRTKEFLHSMMSSGDVGHFDEHGLLYIDGRDDDMIVSGGENVYPQEVEHLLADRPDVWEAAVVGVADAEYGQRLRAVVVPGPDSARDPQEIKDYVKANLARYKVPREVIFVSELPRNATGKILRPPLVELSVD